MTGKNKNAGFTLLETLIGIVLLSIAGFMALSFFYTSMKMEREAEEYADLQTEGRRVMKVLTDGVMGGNAIGFSEDEDSVVFFAGTDISAGEKKEYEGQIFFFDKSSHSLYRKRKDSFIQWEEKISDRHSVKSQLSKEEYMLTDRLCHMEMELLTEDMAGADKKKYEKKGREAVRITLEFSFQDGGSYKVRSAVSLRNRGDIWWENLTEEREDEEKTDLCYD